MSKHTLSRPVSAEHLKVSYNIMRALAHPLRMKMLQFIDSKGSAFVNEIFAALKIEQSIASQHLRILRLAGLVSTSRQQKFVYYHINYDKLNEAAKAGVELAQFVKDE